MLFSELIEFVRLKPFRPFRITLTDGRTYDIVHPDMAVVGFGTVIIGIPPKGQHEVDSERDILVSLLHVMQVEFVEAH